MTSTHGSRGALYITTSSLTQAHWWTHPRQLVWPLPNPVRRSSAYPGTGCRQDCPSYNHARSSANGFSTAQSVLSRQIVNASRNRARNRERLRTTIVLLYTFITRGFSKEPRPLLSDNNVRLPNNVQGRCGERLLKDRVTKRVTEFES